MDHDVRRLLTYLAESQTTHTSGNPSWFGENPDAELLDNFSRAVVGVVGKVAPSVIAITPGTGVSNRGSGVIISPDGFAVTTSSVLAGRTALTIVGHDGQRVDAAVVAVDPATDIALLKVAATGFLHAIVGRSSLLRAGQVAVSVTNPLGLQSTVSTGVIRTVGCVVPSLAGEPIEDVIQHTLALAPDDLGGPLADSRGHIVGINAGTIAAQPGIGWAIPSETIAWVVSELLQHRSVRRVNLGLSVGAARVSRPTLRDLDLLSPLVVRIQAIDSSGPAHQADLREGDLITTICGRLVSSAGAFRRVLAKMQPGAAIEMTIVRDGKIIERCVVA